VRTPAPAAFPADDLTRQAMEEVTALPGLGTVDGFGYAVTAEGARQALTAFVRERLDQFGPYEDAMRADERTLFHSVLSPYLNLGLLTPLEAIQAAVSAYEQGQARLNSVEGFVRQILGWREYMYWQYWRLMPALTQANHWDARRPLPAWFWTGETDLACLRRVIGNSLVHGYAHHIERLMVLGNFSLLAGLEPQAVTDWFKSVYVDAYDWVMQSNAMGMGLNADGGQLATKPYIASAHYIAKMSDHCDTCRYSPKQRTGPDACPFNTLYWNFLIEHEQALKANPRSGPAVLGVGRLTPHDRSEIRARARAWLAALEA
jgi:deoxyribodipyrimidine photolyase-related protein